jgi:hypothetical protein
MKMCFHKINYVVPVAIFVSAMITRPSIAESIDIAPLLSQLKNVGSEGGNAEAASTAWSQLSAIPAQQLPELLAGMNDASPLAENWLRSVADAVAERTVRAGDPLPIEGLRRFLLDTSNSPRARRTAYEWVVKVSPDLTARLLERFLDDPSLELRRDAVTYLLEKVAAAGGETAAKQLLRKAFTASRDEDQIDDITDRLAKYQDAVDLPAHYGFVMRWHLIAPFDNTEKNGFDVSYPPEEEIDLDAKYAGKDGEIGWKIHQSSDTHGIVDLNNAIHNHKGVIGYAYAEFESSDDQDVDIRLGCINANKVWLNGMLLTTNEVYHANMMIDQYVAKGRMHKGQNAILLKIAQNEQSEAWAQRWQFQLRVCDAIGTAILAKNRSTPAPKVNETALNNGEQS